ncbi:uncharacterized protein HRG_08976 [Hirsutella rhossiliensis]|uniref:Uncharacterized protein n=1 Tax=Hirsutella rhossiliensis TaxID=111463 RepID=A0A9P8MRM2_9HYPO|nr:uncharacterized protein HRG_08976 [Hirsutella rhossiliensis]KAH0959955.1 hypothetical protein HRG_08976 [Hirsutella rhossiliensis]
MKISATTLILAAALGVSAHPSGHLHQHLHRSKTFFKSVGPSSKEVNFVDNNALGDSHDSPPEPSYSAPEEPPPSYTPPAKPSPKYEQPSSTGSDSDDGEDNGQGISDPDELCQGGKQKRATLAEIAEPGNTGGTGGQFGCNLKPVPSSFVKDYPDKFKYTVKLNNVGKDRRDQQCTCFLKVGKELKVNGSFKDEKLFMFKLAAGN